MKRCLTIDEVVNLLCQFPGDTPVMIMPHFDEGVRKMWTTHDLVQIVDKDKQPVFVGLTTNCDGPKEQGE